MIDTETLELAGALRPEEPAGKVGLTGPVWMTMINGNIVYKDGILKGVDERRAGPGGRLYAQGSSGNLTAPTGILFSGNLAEKRKGWRGEGIFFLSGNWRSCSGLTYRHCTTMTASASFLPGERNEKNGRRKYEFDQIYELATVSYMRRLGYSLEEIKESEPANSNRAVDIMKQRSQEASRGSGRSCST